MLKDVEQYLADQDRIAAARVAADETFYTARAAIEAERRKEIEAATAGMSTWDTLKKSSDPLVAWIATNAEHYQDYALAILKALPAPLEDLQVIASDGDWCGEWDRLLRLALRAGVVTDGRTQEERELEKELVRYIGTGGTYRSYQAYARAQRKRVSTLEARIAELEAAQPAEAATGDASAS